MRFKWSLTLTGRLIGGKTSSSAVMWRMKINLPPKTNLLQGRHCSWKKWAINISNTVHLSPSYFLPFSLNVGKGLLRTKEQKIHCTLAVREHTILCFWLSHKGKPTWLPVWLELLENKQRNGRNPFTLFLRGWQQYAPSVNHTKPCARLQMQCTQRAGRVAPHTQSTSWCRDGEIGRGGRRRSGGEGRRGGEQYE